MSESSPSRLETDRHAAVRAVLSFVLALGILIVAVGIAVLLFLTGPKADEAADVRTLLPVETLEVEIADFPVEITTQGTVQSRRETRISAELSGRIIEIADGFRRGGVVANGEILARIDPTDFQAALADARSALADAELALAQEEARAEQARVDWLRLGGNRTANPLTLREPQIASVRARIDAAKATVALATENLERTKIRAPFNASVREAMVEVGAVTRPGEPIAELFSAEELEIRLPLTLEDYGFLNISSEGRVEAAITLTGTIGGRSFTWQATPDRLDSEIDRRTLSAFLTARVLPNEANGPNRYPPVGLFTQAQVSGDAIPQVAIIPRRALREGNEVIVITPENRVEFRPVEVARTTRKDAIIRHGLSAGERLCITRLNAPVAGMEVIDSSIQANAEEE